jgi:hypothetical protein
MKRLAALLSGFVFVSLVPRGLCAQEIRSGTEIRVRLLDPLDTGETPKGQKFSAVVEEPVRIDKKTVLAKGTTVKGTVTEVVSPGPLKRPASFTLQLTRLGVSKASTEPLQIGGKSHAVRNTALIGGGAAAGAILGGIAGGGKGALMGTAIGAGAGTGTAYLTGKQELVLPPETELTFVFATDAPAAKRPAPAEPRSIASSGPSTSYFGPGPQAGVGVLIGPPPPPPQVVYVEPQPGPEFVWVLGYWYPVETHYVWHEGYWTRPPYERAHWIAPHYDGERYFAGYWAGVRGRVEHNHGWDHDRDRDFRDRDDDRDREQHAHRRDN